jgi:hypothetical protein
VIGPNEAGKSTIAEAVPAVLFGTDRLERFKPWGRNACSATLFFEGKGRTIQVKRNLITDEVELLERDDLYHTLSQFTGKVPLRGRSASCREYRDLLESLLGISDENLFRATYFFGHHPQEWSGEELAHKLRTLVSGTAETDYAEILDGLLDEHFSLTRVNPWGRDKQRNREYEEVSIQLAKQGGAETVPVFVEIDNSTDIEAQIETLSGELDTDRQEYAKGLRYVERVRNQTAQPSPKPVSVEVEPSAKSQKKPAKGAAFSDQLAAVGLPRNPPRELPELLSEASEVRQEFALMQQPFAVLGSREKKIPLVPWVLLCCISVFLVAASVVAWWKNFYFLPLALFAGTCCALSMGYGAWQHTVRRKALDECRKERNLLEQKKLAAQARQATLSERCEGFGLPSSAIDLVRLQKLVTTHHELLENYWNQDDQPVAQTNQVSDEVTTDDDAFSAADKESLEELRQLETRLAEFESELALKESRLQDLHSQLNELSKDQNPAEINTSSLQLRKRELESRIVVLRKAINLLVGAVDEYGRSHLFRLNNEAGKLFGKMTGGRYSEIKLDESMTPSVQVDGRRWMPVESFSRGTVDAIYLALRIALAKVRDDGRSLPLFFDDPFVHLDQKRLSSALNMIDLASADGQLILFSHNLDLGKRAARERWHVVPLDGNAIETSSEEGGEHAGQLHLL